MLRVFFILLFTFSAALALGQNNSPKVVAIYPTTDFIPVNILRFYIQFSKPVQEMDILKHIKLTNEEGKNITGVFFENQYELWNENRTKVTLIVDPGRVKLGLFANNTMGRAFDVGKKYTLTVDKDLMDFDDQKLAQNFTKTFVAIDEDMLPPKTSEWKITVPKARSNDVLSIDFNDKIDHISAQTLIKFFFNNGEIKGKTELENQERKLVFKPTKKWKKGNYQIIVNQRLEDIATNSVNQIFDHKPSDFNQNNNENFVINFTIQ
ncbi:hypothetical protein LNP04_12090 [Chryseobacterium sp. C-71]|uniref:hypothetical protein n=1 Tax=Chryseobacterium sp. C-71 TaxID=2893882 RepID=UPI001E4F5B1B|nr:hypothetical protein [Chryseobacterium sp. C-71]UFH30714.1 hypothetical protein LNP04_12090 [Chryseobacterium sp. C-71]